MNERLTRLLLTAIATLMTVACANIGTPEGGPRDYTPPAMTRCRPLPGTVNFAGNKVEISFDEYINLKDQQKKVIISPAPKEQPSIKAIGKKITVEFKEPLQPATTYVLDFSDAIEDNNEGNVLDGFAVAFSTGDIIDTMRVSGMVLRASDLEPMQHVLVGLHSNLNDTAFTALPFDRVARTNDRGEFTLMGVAPGSYRVYALNDMNGDYRMQRNEDYAWLDNVVVPSTRLYSSSDTTFTFDRRVDTVQTATHVEYLPNNLLLSMMNENYSALYLRKSDRPSDNRLQILFSTRAPQLPRLTPIMPRPARDDWYSLERRAANDSLVYWLSDSTLIRNDSIVIAMDYLKTDSLDRLQWQRDTLTLVYNKPNSVRKQEAQMKKDRDRRRDEIARLKERRAKLLAEGKNTEEEDEQLLILQKADSEPPPVLKIETAKTILGIADSIAISATEPIAYIDPRGVRLELMNAEDSTWTAVTIPAMTPADTCSRMRWTLPMLLDGGRTYRFTVDSLAVQSIYGVGNNPATVTLNVRGTDEYANLFFHVKGLNGKPAFVQLLDERDTPLRQVPVDNSGEVEILNVEAGNYYARLVLDLNDNAKWDTGKYAKHLQPEDVFYFPDKLKLRKNWDVEQTWDLYATPVNRQKADAIKRNKPEKRGGKLEPNEKRSGEDEDEVDPFGTGFGGRRQNTYSGDKYRDSH